MTTSFTAIHFFYDSVIISRQHLNPRVKETAFISQYFLQPSIIINGLRLIWEKGWRVCLSEENHGSPAVLKVPIYSTELVAIIFVSKVMC